MNKHLKSIELLDVFFQTHSKEEIELIFNEVAQMQFEGPTFEEYLQNFSSAFEYEFEHGITMPFSSNVYPKSEFSENKNNQQVSITVSPAPHNIFSGSVSENSFSDDPNSNISLAA